jgi:hypothetical protein
MFLRAAVIKFLRNLGHSFGSSPLCFDHSSAYVPLIVDRTNRTDHMSVRDEILLGAAPLN